MSESATAQRDYATMMTNVTWRGEEGMDESWASKGTSGGNLNEVQTLVDSNGPVLICYRGKGAPGRTVSC